MNKLIILLAVVFLGISACGGGGNGGGGDGGDTEPNRDVYVAGYISDGGKRIAAYWKNGEEIRLDSGDASAEAKSIYVTDSDVHVVGGSWYYNSPGSTAATYTAKYWLNGTEITLDNGTGTGTFPPSSDPVDTYASADSVFVSGSDVYIAGYAAYNGVTRAKFWLDGIDVNLGDYVKGSRAYSVFISDGDVYIAGEDYHNGSYKCAYWVNGVPKYVDEMSFTSIYVSGTDVYLAGTRHTNELNAAAYLKHNANIPTSLSDEESAADSIFVSGSDVYVAGHKYVCIESDDDAGDCTINGFMAVYWKNEAEIELTGGVGISYAKSIVVSGKDVYVAGYVYDGTKLTATYWKNGTMIPLSDKESAANAIFVK